MNEIILSVSLAITIVLCAVALYIIIRKLFASNLKIETLQTECDKLKFENNDVSLSVSAILEENKILQEQKADLLLKLQNAEKELTELRKSELSIKNDYANLADEFERLSTEMKKNAEDQSGIKEKLEKSSNVIGILSNTLLEIKEKLIFAQTAESSDYLKAEMMNIVDMINKIFE